ncbi:enoyl-CoA hydratase/isomerase family protein [Spongiibacter sp. KMU-158]|uniref:3-hydroxyisobutyryl-CoA hydrolase n=1 Tax=Spongiibacter pelagi TaxID=2760804 RepID=A0A927C1M1_9GAMM|nr:enoyl-CoA hydratase/isomerase family protein [Spongiibacter pelagi]MBD2858222.1 enoyl-CoA hydratase/isomerase family protein [Spongiibacter pelagi]
MQIGFTSQRHVLPGGGYLVQLSLNAPTQLNALCHEMAELLLRQLRLFIEDPEALGLILDSTTDKAFSVGADLRRIRESAMANPGGEAVEAEAFFTSEFALVQLIYQCPKPVLCWADGFTMGSGLSVLAASSHRVVGSAVAASLPETGLGFFPNAGLNYFLHQMPGKLGLFTALTGIQLNLADLLYGGLADYCFDSNAKSTVLAGLLDLDWEEDAEANAELLTEYLSDIEAELGASLPGSELKAHREWVDQHCEGSLSALDVQLESATGDAWLTQAAQGFRRAAASSQKILYRLQKHCEHHGLAEVLRLELGLVSQRIRDPEFSEGVRARLLGKDRDPHWCYATISDVPESEINALFALL